MIMYNNIYNKNIVTLQFRSTASVVCNCKIKYIMPTYCFAILRDQVLNSITVRVNICCTPYSYHTVDMVL